MSLINDALKKAQKMRTQDPAASAPSLSSGNSGPVAKRARPMSARWLAGLVAGAAVLVAASVLVTVFWLRTPGATLASRPVTPPAAVSESPTPMPAAPPARKVEPSPAPGLTTAAPPSIVVVAPPAAVGGTARVAPQAETHPTAASPGAPASPPESAPPSPVGAAGVPPVSDVPAPTVASAALHPAAPPAPAARPDPRIQAFVDALRVAGIRASGSDSKVLMNDRVFRVNDIVERTLALRLTGVAADRLSFTDENGVVYTRNF
jgi:hypothetical protein